LPSADTLRWNTRYLEPGRANQSSPRDLLVRFQGIFPSGALVLDMAMGTGANAKFLIEKGCRVVGVDISDVAVRIAKVNCGAIMPLFGDSQSTGFADNTFDAILNFYFLDRGLWDIYKKILKTGGILFFETPSKGTDEGTKSFPKDYLIGKNELLQVFPSWDILYKNREVITSATHRTKVIEKLILRKA
jgi:SAM-dependent methyltransferase